MASDPDQLAARGLISPKQMGKMQVLMDANQPVGLPSPPSAEPGILSSDGLSKPQDVAPNWIGSPGDKQRAMNIMNMRMNGQPVHPDAMKWYDEYMKQVDQALPPIRGR
jgi:hypothetical protein